MNKKSYVILLFLMLAVIGLVSAEISSFDGELRVTDEHPFLVDGEWIPASELEIGDELQSLE